MNSKPNSWHVTDESYYALIVADHLGNPDVSVLNRITRGRTEKGSFETRSNIEVVRWLSSKELSKNDCLLGLARTVAIGMKALESEILKIINDEKKAKSKKAAAKKAKKVKKPTRRAPSNKLIE